MSGHRLSIAFVAGVLGFLSLAGGLAGALAKVTNHSALSSTRAEDVTIIQNDLKRTIECSGGSVRVSGNRNTLNLTGECSTLFIDGDDNVVTVQAVGEISTWGNRNKVTWTRGLGGKPPKISNPGTKNTIEKAK